jgi:tryptophan synthase beta chain
MRTVMKKEIPYQMILPQSEIPTQWYNIVPDLPHQPPAPLSPATGKPATPDELSAIFPKGIIEQEMTAERMIDIPQDVREKYKLFRPTPLHRAYRLEKYLQTPAHIYYKYEGTNPSGSHKLNSAVAQAYYNKAAGIKRLTTETGAGQWGTALSMATSFYDMECQVYMVRVSFDQKPYRKSIMRVYGADVAASPSERTKTGRDFRIANPDSPGSLGVAISEAIEDAAGRADTNYALGSVLNHVILHQTVIGQESKRQLEQIDEYPDIVIGCNGGGSNFSGLAFPFVRDRLAGHTSTRFIAVEPLACPKMTRGKFTYDYNDTAGMTPITRMYSLGHTFMPSSIHAGGLRYHGDSRLLSQLHADGVVEATAVGQREVFESAVLFANCEAILPAPESAHAICQAVKEARRCAEAGEEKIILFGLSGNGYLDLSAYEAYLNGELRDEQPGLEEEIRRSLAEMPEIG